MISPLFWKGRKHMDKEQEQLQFLGFFGILKESFKIISSWKRIFSQITLALILPLSFIFLAHIEISVILFANIMINEDYLDHTKAGTPRYAKLSDIISSEWTAFWLFKLSYFIFFLILSLLSTSAGVYTIACIYTAKEITFKKIMKVVPKVWKRLMVTFIWSFIIVFLYNTVAVLLFVISVFLIGFNTTGILILTNLLIIYLVGFVYISIIWHLASVISVLEDGYGIQAMIKSKALIKGNMGVSTALFLLLTLSFIAIQVAFQFLVVFGFGDKLMLFYAVLCWLLLSMLILFSLIIQTVIYFVCKSYHHENIDKPSLSDHLGAYLGEYVPLKSKDVQLEQFQV